MDIGSTTTKAVLLEDGALLAHAVAPTGANCRQTAAELLDQCLQQAERQVEQIAHATSTGYGRRLVVHAGQPAVLRAAEAVSEITCNARGALWLAGNDTPVRTIVDIGGQDSKVIALDEGGNLADFAMNDKCAAGTGRFLEVMARILEVEVDELGWLSQQATEPAPINSTCTVFAESEVVSLLAQGCRVPDIIAGVHQSIARRVAGLVRSVGLVERVLFDGGPALNRGLTQALAQELGTSLIVPDRPQVATAIGAALIAAERALAAPVQGLPAAGRCGPEAGPDMGVSER